MIERTGDQYELICDHCEKTVSGFDTFQEAVNFKRVKGWKSVKTKSMGWAELCPICAKPDTIREYRDK